MGEAVSSGRRRKASPQLRRSWPRLSGISRHAPVKFHPTPACRNKLRRSECRVANRGLRRQVEAMENHCHNDDHGDQRGDIQTRRLSRETHQRGSTGKADHRPDNNLGQRVHAKHEAGNSDHNRRQKRRRAL